MFLSIILCISVFFMPIHSIISINLLFMLGNNIRRRNEMVKKQKDLINEKFKNENKTIDQFIDCASKMNAGELGLELIKDVKYTMQTKREKYNQYNINKSETWTSCIHEQQQIFQKMKDTYLVRICIGFITNSNQDIDTLYNDIVHKEIRIRYYNYHL
uniref:Uncharacterized protein n=1 Tax=Schistosoma mansoni TaxID=6183 RepID=A0A5K4F4J0_SCHMA